MPFSQFSSKYLLTDCALSPRLKCSLFFKGQGARHYLLVCCAHLLQLAALVPRTELGEGVQFPHLPAGQLPSSSSNVYEWVCLGVLPLKKEGNYGEECGMMLCLLARHEGFWYFKPVLKPVTAFTPQGLIEPAQV